MDSSSEAWNFSSLIIWLCFIYSGLQGRSYDTNLVGNISSSSVEKNKFNITIKYFFYFIYIFYIIW